MNALVKFCIALAYNDPREFPALGVSLHTGATVEEIHESGLAMRPDGGTTQQIAVDTIVLAGAPESDTAQFDAVRADVPEVHAVGDCTGLGLVRKATEEATRIACAV